MVHPNEKLLDPLEFSTQVFGFETFPFYLFER